MPKKSKKKMKGKMLIKIALAIVLLIGFFYLIKISIAEYQKQVESLGITVCDDTECFKTMHIHADIDFDLCGQSPVLPRETGPLSGLHTHKEKDLLHFHDKVVLDFEARSQNFDERLSLREVINIFQLNPDKYCGSGDVEIKTLVNGIVPAEGLDYNWIDGDDIQLIYEAK